MTEIEKGLFKIISKAVRASKESGRRNTGTHTLIEGAVREALLYLDSEGMVRKVDRELPKSPDTDYLISQYEGEKATAEDVALMHLNGIEKGKSLMLTAGYVAVEPLVKE